MFLIQSRLIAVFPPTEASPADKTVVGTADHAAADGNHAVLAGESMREQFREQVLQRCERLAALSLRDGYDHRLLRGGSNGFGIPGRNAFIGDDQHLSVKLKQRSHALQRPAFNGDVVASVFQSYRNYHSRSFGGFHRNNNLL